MRISVECGGYTRAADACLSANQTSAVLTEALAGRLEAPAEGERAWLDMLLSQLQHGAADGHPSGIAPPLEGPTVEHEAVPSGPVLHCRSAGAGIVTPNR